MFYNYTNEDFTYTWGGKPYKFKAGEVYDGFIVSSDGSDSIKLNDILSRFFAKHLAEHVLNSNKDVSGNPLKYNVTNMDMLTERGITPPSASTPMPEFVAELKILEKGKEPDAESAKEMATEPEPEPVAEVAVEAKRRGRPKKSDSPSPGAEFAM